MEFTTYKELEEQGITTDRYSTFFNIISKLLQVYMPDLDTLSAYHATRLFEKFKIQIAIMNGELYLVNENNYLEIKLLVFLKVYFLPDYIPSETEISQENFDKIKMLCYVGELMNKEIEQEQIEARNKAYEHRKEVSAKYEKMYNEAKKLLWNERAGMIGDPWKVKN
jgi:hypothetical protein